MIAAAVRATYAPPGSERRAYPGDLAQVREVRRWVAGLLPRCPGLDDLVTVASELAANAVQHTDSGRSGWFAVEVRWSPGRVRITVADQGAPAGPRLASTPAAECGRGLQIVRALSACVGVTGGSGGRSVWAEMSWTDQPEPGRPRGGEDEACHGAPAGPEGRPEAPVAAGPHGPRSGVSSWPS